MNEHQAAAVDAAEPTSEEIWCERGVTGESIPDGEYKTHLVQVWMCEGCLLGIGKECHSGGCVMCWHRGSGFPLMPELVKMVGTPPVIEVGRMLRDPTGCAWAITAVDLGGGTVTLEKSFSGAHDRVVLPWHLAETMRSVE